MRGRGEQTLAVGEEAAGVDGVRRLGLPPPPVVAVQPLPAASLDLVELHQQMKPAR